MAALNELMVITVWAALAARTVMGNVLATVWRQAASRAVRLAPTMRTVRRAIMPVTMVMIGFAPFGQAHGLPGSSVAGAAIVERPASFEAYRDGISLDEAVARAERQYRARVVRTDVTDEDGRVVYVLKLLSEDGRVFTVRIDASTGRMR